MRQWVPQTQHAVDSLVTEVLKRGAHPDDRDSLTDMTLLMYSCKVGDMARLLKDKDDKVSGLEII